MSEFTVEDFAQANLATRGNAEVARRTDPGDTCPWLIFGGERGWQSDEGMALAGWVPVVEAGTITLDGLRAAWEAAEVPTDDNPIRAGDVMIFPIPDGYAVRKAVIDAGLWRSDTRILSRAPQREPWANLADVLGDFAIHDHNGEEYPDVLARRLYERGVRVTGGDDDE